MQEDTWVVLLWILGCFFCRESGLDRYFEAWLLWAGGRFVCSTGVGEEKTQAVAWNATLGDVKETRFFFALFFS